MADILFSVILLIALLPVLLLISVAIVCEDKGPILFKQTRIGFKQQRFTILKFRTMTVASSTDEDWNTLVDIRPFPHHRITVVGRYLRRLKFDELPQLLNVLTGDLSLVGPRPYIPEEVELMGKVAAVRHSIKPGITGLAQVNGNTALPPDERISLDLEYIRSRSWAVDVSILLKTLPSMLAGDHRRAAVGQQTRVPD